VRRRRHTNQIGNSIQKLRKAVSRERAALEERHQALGGERDGDPDSVPGDALESAASRGRPAGTRRRARSSARRSSRRADRSAATPCRRELAGSHQASPSAETRLPARTRKRSGSARRWPAPIPGVISTLSCRRPCHHAADRDGPDQVADDERHADDHPRADPVGLLAEERRDHGGRGIRRERRAVVAHQPPETTKRP